MGVFYQKHDFMLDSSYITGFAENAGSFTYSKSRGTITLYFSIKSSVKDLQLLLKIREYFKVGKVYRGKTDKKWIHYRVNKLGDLIKIVNHFERYQLEGVKQHAFDIWKQMIICKRRKLPKDRETLMKLAEKLSGFTNSR